MSDDVIDLQITVTDKAPEEPNFGVPMIAGFHTRFPELVREYEEAGDMIDDGFLTSDPEYQAALILKQQDPSVERFKIGRLAAATFTHTVRLTPTNVTANLTYSGTIGELGAEEDFTFDVQSGDAVADVCDDLATNIGAIADVTVTDNTTDVDVAADNSETVLTFKGLSKHLDIEDITTVNGTNLQADLAAINDEDSDWYGLALTINAEDAILAAAAWTEANGKIFVPMSADSGITDAGDTTDIASQLLALSYTRTAGIFHRDIGGTEWANVAFLAINLSPTPGSYTPAFKELKGISVDDLKPGAKTALKAKYWTRYIRQRGANVTFEGRTPSGRFFDVTRFVDWQSFVIENDFFNLLVNSPKVPYTKKGISSGKLTVEGSIRQGVTAGGIDDESPITVTVPALSETTQADRSNRILRNVKFNARMTGALHGVQIRGNLSV